ncbi:DUF2637 domain-containing protein [Streptomyces uncialis]|uniref:DUF2637 domain-containing protein n=1 Tax=Streptomyces uncialis TaxID=1048205 RepID=UPI003870ED36|nr:DUF2637 domain-containing protein [Streptomyces uncialis]
MAGKVELTRTHRILIGVVVAGAVVIAGIGFAGSYAAVRELALTKGFGNFSYVFPIGIDAGICVLLALDLLLTWIRIPFPLLRQTAWLLTLATIAFNGAAAWPDPLGVGMHSVIPVLFVVTVEAARHAVGRIADITADKHMEGVRLTRWLLSPVPTFLLWRRMKLWELRSYDQVIKLEQERLVYRARLRSRYGRSWRRKAPVESLMPLRLAKYGVPLAETAPSGLAAAGIEPAVLPPVAPQAQVTAPGPVAGPAPALGREPERQLAPAPRRAPEPGAEPGTEPGREPEPDPGPEPEPEEGLSPWFKQQQQQQRYEGGYDPSSSYEPPAQYQQWYDEQDRYESQQGRRYQDERGFEDQRAYEDGQAFEDGFRGDGHQGDGHRGQEYPRPEYVRPEPPRPGFHVPSGPGQTRPLGHGTIPGPRTERDPQDNGLPVPDGTAPDPSEARLGEAVDAAVEGVGQGVGQGDGQGAVEAPRPDSRFPEGMSQENAYYQVFRQSTKGQGSMPTPASFGADIKSTYGIQESDAALKRYVKSFGDRLNTEMTEEHIA